MLKNYFFYFLLASSLFLNANAAQFRWTDSDICKPYYLEINGGIERGDAAKFSNFLKKSQTKYEEQGCPKSGIFAEPYFQVSVSLNSNGGDVNESMKIGYLIREREGQTFVYPNKICLSSCVFILAAGVFRQVSSGKVGIHRPYFQDLKDNLSTSEIKKIRDESVRSWKKYFNDMDIAEALVDAMLSIDPSKMKILNESELEFFRLDGTDANWDEKITAQDARKWNLTSSEYRKKQTIASKCHTREAIQNRSKCEYMTFLDITSQEYESRKLRVSKCFGEEFSITKESDLKFAESCMFKILVLNQ